MPGLRCFRRRWQFGADDLTIPSFFCSLTRTTWISLLIVFFVAAKRVHCSEEVYVFTSIAIGIYSVTAITYLSMLVVSCRGTVLEVEKRWCMPSLFKILLCVVLCEFSMAVYGANVVGFDAENRCNAEIAVPFNIILTVVATSWVDLSLTFCCAMVAVSVSTRDDDDDDRDDNGCAIIRRSWFCWGESSTATSSSSSALLPKSLSTTPLLEGEAEDVYEFSLEQERQTDADNAYFLGTLPSSEAAAVLNDNAFTTTTTDIDDIDAIDNDDLDEELRYGRSTKTWSRRLRRLTFVLQILTCGMFGCCCGTPKEGRGDAFKELATVLAGWFTNLELVPTDIVAALFLMRAEQVDMEKRAIRELETASMYNSNNSGRRLSNRLTSVGRWMWTHHGANTRATHQLHAQQVRESRDARRIRTDSTMSFQVYTPQDHESTPSSAPPLEVDPEAKQVLMLASEMAPYMLGMYGWFFFTYMRGIRGWLSIFCCCCCRGNGHARESDENEEDMSLQRQAELMNGGTTQVVIDDGCCRLNVRALERVKPSQAQVVYASFTSLSGRTVPYCVCVDHSQRRVVVSVRGELTLSDVITHGSMIPASLMPHAKRWGFQDEIDTDSYAHAGILSVAAWMRQDLQQKDVLHRLFGISVQLQGDQDEEFRQSFHERLRSFSLSPSDLPDCRGYSLELTGHSLGAGVAVILSLFLRPVFPNVHCLAFSPPGCVFDFKLANRCSAWVNSIFVGDDMVVRLSWHSLFKLRAQILDTLRRDKVTKYGAIFSWVWHSSIDQLLYPTDAVPDTEHSLRMQRKIDELGTVRKSNLLDTVRLYCPGKILHLYKAATEKSWYCCGKSTTYYVPMWIDDRSALDEILLGPRMALDHFPDAMDSALSQVVLEFCKDRRQQQQQQQ